MQAHSCRQRASHDYERQQLHADLARENDRRAHDHVDQRRRDDSSADRRPDRGGHPDRRRRADRESRDQDQQPAITLNAGAGGITINQINDYDYTGTSSVNAKDANLTLNSIGNVSILDDRGVATTQTLTIDTRSQILTGKMAMR